MEREYKMSKARQEELQEEDVFDEEELDESDPFYFSEGPKL